MEKNQTSVKLLKKNLTRDDFRILYGTIINAYREIPDLDNVTKYIRQGIRFLWKNEVIPLETKCIYIRAILNESGILGKVFLENSFVKVHLSDPEEDTPRLKESIFFEDFRMVSATRLTREFLDTVEMLHPEMITYKIIEIKGDKNHRKHYGTK